MDRLSFESSGFPLGEASGSRPLLEPLPLPRIQLGLGPPLPHQLDSLGAHGIGFKIYQPIQSHLEQFKILQHVAHQRQRRASRC